MPVDGLARFGARTSVWTSRTSVSPFSDDPESAFRYTQMILQELDLPAGTLDDRRHVQHVCWQVSQRGAFLAATGKLQW